MRANALRFSAIGPAVALAIASAAHSAEPSSSPIALKPDTSALETEFQHNSYPIELRDGQLTGVGAKFLEKASEPSQFVLIGEQHRSREIPLFTEALFALLQRRHGFNHLALEQDPLAAMIASGPARGDIRKIARYARRYPDAFTFNTDQELDLIASAGRARGASEPVWGLDQTFGAIHVLDRLVELAPDASVRRRTARIADEVRRLETGRRQDNSSFMLPDVKKSAAFLSLPEFYRRAPGSEADLLIEQLFKSLDIYRNWWLATHENKPTRWAQSSDREENMKALFMLRYRAAQRAGEREPKVVVKAGHYHAIRGENWSDLPSLGDFLAQFAKANRRTSFHLAVWNNNDRPGDFEILSKDRDFGALFRSASARRWTIIDFRPLRARAYADQLPGLTPELKKVLFGFDAALLIGSGTGGTYRLAGIDAAPKQN